MSWTDDTLFVTHLCLSLVGVAQLVEIIPYAGLQFGTYSALRQATARWNAAEARATNQSTNHSNPLPPLFLFWASPSAPPIPSSADAGPARAADSFGFWIHSSASYIALAVRKSAVGCAQPSAHRVFCFPSPAQPRRSGLSGLSPPRRAPAAAPPPRSPLATPWRALRRRLRPSQGSRHSSVESELVPFPKSSCILSTSSRNDSRREQETVKCAPVQNQTRQRLPLSGWLLIVRVCCASRTAAGGGIPTERSVRGCDPADDVPQHDALPGVRHSCSVTHLPSASCCAGRFFRCDTNPELCASGLQGTILAKEGSAGLYKGLLPNLLKASPAMIVHRLGGTMRK